MNPDDFDRAEAYVLDELPAAERAAFERELAGDERLRREVDRLAADVHAVRLRAIEGAVAAAGARFRAGATDSAHTAPRRPARRPARRRALRRYLAPLTAAAAVLLVALWVGGLVGGAGDAATDQPAGAFAPAVGLPTTLGDDEGDERAFTEGMIDYKRGDFAAALARWEPLLATRPDDDTLAFYTAVGLIAEGREALAVRLLADVDEPALAERRDWYLAQAYRRSRRSAEATALLEQIAAGGGRYAAEAAAVLAGE